MSWVWHIICVFLAYSKANIKWNEMVNPGWRGGNHVKESGLAICG